MTEPRVVSLSWLDRLGFLVFLGLRYVLGFVVPKRWALALFTTLGTDRFLNGFTARLAQRYGADLLWADLKIKRLLIVVHPDAIDTVLGAGSNTVDPFVKKRSIAAFAPNALVVSGRPQWERRRQFNECVLDFGAPQRSHGRLRHGTDFALVIDKAVQDLQSTDNRLRWPEFQQLARCITHQVLFGAGASAPDMARRMSRMAAFANWQLPRFWTRRKFRRELEGRLDAARNGPPEAASLIADAIGCLHGADDVDVPGQTSFWFFVLQDALELHVARTLVLIRACGDTYDAALAEARGLQAPTADLGPTPHIECCVRESLRLWTPVPLLLRRQIDKGPVNFGSGDATVAVGLEPFDWIVIDAAGYHRNARFFGDMADEFKPGDASQAVPRYFFSDGPRACAGQHLVIPLVAHTIAALLRRFEFTLVKPVVSPARVPQLINHYAVEFAVQGRPRQP